MGVLCGVLKYQQISPCCKDFSKDIAIGVGSDDGE